MYSCFSVSHFDGMRMMWILTAAGSTFFVTAAQVVMCGWCAEEDDWIYAILIVKLQN